MIKCKFLTGPEMAHTNFNGLHTLFVAGFAYSSKILDMCSANNIKHVHLGYECTFQNNKMYNQIILDLFNAGLKVTLEYPASEYHTMQDLINLEVWNNRNFVPLMTVEIGKTYLLGQNSSIQFVDGQSNNAGTWSSKFSSVLDSNNYESVTDINTRISALSEQKETVNTELHEPAVKEIVTTDVVIAPVQNVDVVVRRGRAPNPNKKAKTNAKQ